MKSGISMPLACVSCDHYQHEGMKQDSECPFSHAWSNRRKDKTHYGKCHKHSCKVFATQICTSHQYPIDVMEVHQVPNRSKPLEPFQENLFNEAA